MRSKLIRFQHELARRSLTVAACAGVVAVASCSAPPGSELDSDGPGEFAGPLPGVGTTPSMQAPSPQAAPGSSPTANANPQPAAPGASEQPASNGTPLSPSAPPPAGANNSGAGGASMVSGDGDVSVGGSAMNGGGAGGAAPIEPPPPAQQPPPATPPAQQPPPVTPPAAPAGPDIPCPADATFCSGFEGAGLPAGAVFQPTYLAGEALGGQVELDTAVVRSGAQSLHMPAGANYYRMLAVPVPGNSFWVRLYTQSDVGFGAEGSTHAALFMASTFAPDGDYNGDTAVEIAEQFNQILLNVRDSLFGTSGTNPNGNPGTTLPDNTWTCMEAQFDGPTGDVRVFVEGEQIIDATGWQPPSNFNSFRFGYLRFSSPERDVWMDDVVVAASRVGCQ